MTSRSISVQALVDKMAVPMHQVFRVGSNVVKQHLKGVKRYPLVLMLEPLFRCNLACAGCGKIDYPDEILNQRLSVQECPGGGRMAGACPHRRYNNGGKAFSAARPTSPRPSPLKGGKGDSTIGALNSLSAHRGERVGVRWGALRGRRYAYLMLMGPVPAIHAGPEPAS